MSDERPQGSAAEEREARWGAIWSKIGHIYHTRIRTTTVILVVLFVAGTVLYGFTSTHYGVAPEVNTPPPPRNERTTSPYPSSTTSHEPSTSSVEPSSESSESESPVSGQPRDGGSTSSTTSPGLRLPNLGRTSSPSPTTTGPQGQEQQPPVSDAVPTA
ncbi:MAG: hypothetical protein QM658_05215 [Gordonia sp. (in: high G+C Gram-positive bacteria)]